MDYGLAAAPAVPAELSLLVFPARCALHEHGRRPPTEPREP
jgi:hypothetical protein